MLASGDGTVDLNIDNGTFVVDVSTSRVGVGTSSPSRKLHVDSGTTDTVALFESSGDAAAYLVVKDSGSSGGAFFGANGTSTIIGTGGSTERLRIDSSGNVGIGTSSLTGGNTILNLSRTGSGVGCNMQFANSHNGAFYVGLAGNTSGDVILHSADGTAGMAFGTGNTERMRIDANGNVGIGMSPVTLLDIKEGTGATDAIIGITAGTGGRAQIRSEAQADNTSSELSFHTMSGSSTSERMRIDSSGIDVTGTATATKLVSTNGVLELDDNGSHNGVINVPASLFINIDSDNGATGEDFVIAKDRTGTSGGTELFRVQEDGYVEMASASQVRLTLGSAGTAGSNTANWIRGNGTSLGYNSAGGAHAWEVSGTSRMTLDASGNLLVGTTNTNPAENNVNGISLYNDGRYFGGTTSNEAMRLNRKSTDGGILIFHKDGTTVGVIGSQTLAGSSELFIGNGGNIGLGFEQTGVDKIFPCNGSTGAARDAAIDLGAYSERFGNGYFAGDVNATNFTGVGDGDTFINMPGSNIMRILTGNSERMEFEASGQITTNAYNYNNVDGHKFTPAGTFQIGMNYNSTGAEIILVNNRTSGGTVSLMQYRTAGAVEGSIVGNSSGLSISNVSDYRMKENIADLTGSLDVINALQPRTYTYKAGFGKSSETQVGFIAHEFAEEIPSAVTGAKDAVYTQADIDEGVTEVTVGSEKLQTLAYSSDEVITRLIGAIQEQQATITALTARIETLENN